MTGSLDARFEPDSPVAFLNGNHALIRMMTEQMRSDAAAGLRTKAFVTGYPGSPLGSIDIALRQARRTLDAHGITHRAAQNEEFAVSMLSGTQMLDEHPHPEVDGVVGYWYGKGPGLDRSGDVLKHANFAGTSRHGAVVILSGEDHEAKSSTVPYQQDFSFEHHGMPVLYPSCVQEFLDYGLHAAALSRYSGCWVALKLVGTLCDGGEVVQLHPAGITTRTPDLQIAGKPFAKLANHRFFPVTNVETERRLYDERHAAVLAYSRANGLNRIVRSSPEDRIGILSAGKSWADTMQALEDLGLDARALEANGIRLAKVGLLCPSDSTFFREFAEGLESVIVVEEKRDFLERQVAAGIVGTSVRALLGKQDVDGTRLFPVEGGMTSDMVAERLGRVLARSITLPVRGRERVRYLQQKTVQRNPALPGRAPNYCSGCPHNVSTLLAPGQMAWGAPGCHLFAALMDKPQKRVEATTPLGGEGVPWLGLAPYTSRPHIVQNVGDGALFHSSYQNIRFAITTGANMTFKLLINGVLANTGGQEAVGASAIADLAGRLLQDGASRVVLVSKELAQYAKVQLPAGLVRRSPDELEQSMKELSETQGVTILIYDGACANERRRRQKRGLLPAPSVFTFVNEEVCENCGDCGAKANCMSLQKVPTEFGAKTQIHQSTCNQDQACIQGECPSFVTVEVEPGKGLRKPALPSIDAAGIPEIEPQALQAPYHVYIPGLGGSGVLTASAILAQAAAMQGLQVKTYDQTGASQKWGAVLSSLILAPADRPPHTNKVGIGKADLYLALDLLAAVDVSNLKCCDAERTRSVINAGVFPNGEVIRDSRKALPTQELCETVAAAVREDGALTLDAQRIAEALFGDYMMTNMVAIGAAYQAGWLPIRAEWIEAAIALNGTQVNANTTAFRAGRLWVHAPERIQALGTLRLQPLADRTERLHALRSEGRLGELVAFEARLAKLPTQLRDRVLLRSVDLADYQNMAYAVRYLERVTSFVEAEAAARGERHAYEVTAAVADGLHKMMAYKDEYEVARLLTSSGFEKRVADMFSGTVRLKYNLQPPLARTLGLKGKVRVGGWMYPMLKVLAALKVLRGTALDPFGALQSRREERALLAWYESVLAQGLELLDGRNAAGVAELMRLPQAIRGYESVKSAAATEAKAEAQRLLSGLKRPRSIEIVPVALAA
ncbi:indolepyruvate ferredoxin oxidoreductase [Variovorax sp. PBL-H6]|uniref:indolepyruvate ferredoxin oxidoreductase family protein n=1 Tax=Variovorax sp. PBL-H6 TaxID=434009 RepID=UPI00131647D9|nr:indolepyruvate ferredoxin oxidoreductase family protein [Variovorax sp. PBL-H6]VTU19001.1 indolepyruvate ferredoxin oxidoreductase [Variovorax sp. PBL-H6]